MDKDYLLLVQGIMFVMRSGQVYVCVLWDTYFKTVGLLNILLTDQF